MVAVLAIADLVVIVLIVLGSPGRLVEGRDGGGDGHVYAPMR